MEQLNEYIDNMVVRLQEEEKALIASHRKDEANLIKVKINVYGIAKTLMDVAKKLAKDGEERVIFKEKVESLSETWQKIFEEAIAHNDVEKIVVEEAKREALDDVRSRCN